MSRWIADDIPDLTRKRALVTGANSGIGLVEARAQKGADVVLAVRKTEADEKAANRIRSTGTPGSVQVDELDLASLDSVRALAERTFAPIHGSRGSPPPPC